MAVDLQSSEFWKKKAHRAIRVRDTNRDGTISKEDFDMVIEHYRDMGTSEEHLKKLSDSFSKTCLNYGMADEGRKLTYDEFAAHLSENGKIPGRDERSKAFVVMFDIIDSNCNGEISFKEWTDYYKTVGIDVKHARASFDAMDADGNGIVSKEEFIAYVDEYFFTTEDKLNSSILYGPLDEPLD